MTTDIEPTDMGGAPIDLEDLGEAAREWLEAAKCVDVAANERDSANAAWQETRRNLQNVETELIAAADLTTNTRSVRRIIVPLDGRAALVVVDHEGAHALAALMCPAKAKG